MTKPHTDDLLATLNPAQREAVLHFDGPMLVLAGAGSGKTRVLTTRIARLIQHHGVDPSHILAVTFTNKAAGEMRERIGRILGHEPRGMWAGTFHAIGARLLRAAAPLVGRTANFTIYDEDDALGLVKRVMEREGVSPKEWSPKAVMSAISDAKNRLVSPAEYERLALDAFSKACAKVYRQLEPALRASNAVTFDDLLVLPVQVMREHPERLAEYQRRFRYVLVDEYQDTNRAQYEFVVRIGSVHRNVVVVGDDDQCLVEGTLVTMADGSRRAIEEVRAGDEVRAALGSGRFGPAAVTRVHRHEGRREGIAITLRSGRRLVSTPEHTHFAGYHRPRSRSSSRRNVVLTLCGERRATTAMHRISVVGNDEPGRRALEEAGFHVRGAKARSASWRYESAFREYDDVCIAVERMRSAFPDLNVFQVARLGANRELAGATNSLPFTPAASVLPGMAMFDEEGSYDTVERVERVALDRPVFDLDVEGVHNYVADGIVTHNSIYGWRGADIRNILDFEKDFPAAKVVRLEDNYRSAPPILDLANVVIAANTGRRGKTLRATQPPGEKVTIVGAFDERDEADFVVDEISARRGNGGLVLRDFAILYRTNAQSRAMEESLRRRGFPYRLVGGVRFYDRREIRDLIAYLRLIANPSDNEAFRRAVAVPKRGLGDTTVEALAQAATREGIALLEAARRPELVAGLRPAARAALADFSALTLRLRDRARDASVDELLRELVDAIRYGDHLKAEGPEGAERLENVRALIDGAAETVADDGGEVGLTPLDHFLQKATLVAGIDGLDPNADAVVLMTMHNAKGLEFPVVFVTGLEDGLFPLAKAYDDPAMLEEERRLFYVGITRAERKLFVTHAEQRRRNGELLPSRISSFLEDIPRDKVEQRKTIKVRSSGRATLGDGYGAGGYGGGFGSGRGTFGSGGAWRGARGGAGQGSRPTARAWEDDDAPVTDGRKAGTPVSRMPVRNATPRSAEPEDQSQDQPVLAVGSRVKHRKFGGGRIAELTGSGRDMKVRIDFDDESIGRKTLVVAQANLEPEWD